MTIEAEAICDSVDSAGARLTTFVLRYPRFIHSEVMTHRAFSRNAASSRAIPVNKMIDQALTDPACPNVWQNNKPGMQGGALLSEDEIQRARIIWFSARDEAVRHAKGLAGANVNAHKQLVNRILEPFIHIDVVLTGTDFSGFFAQRIHKDAEPHIAQLAEKMSDSMRASSTTILRKGSWHMPFIRPEDYDRFRAEVRRELIDAAAITTSVARCARVSYMNHDNTTATLEQDVTLYKRLLSAVPPHASPFEHQAVAAAPENYKQSNLKSWLQYRQTLMI